MFSHRGSEHYEIPSSMTIFFVVPAMKIGGGIREIVSLARDISRSPADVTIISMWTAEHAMDCPLPVLALSRWRPRAKFAPLQLPLLYAKFLLHVLRRRWAGVHRSDRYIFTHYSTLTFAALAGEHQRLFFVQDLEWKFLHNATLVRWLRQFILHRFRSGRLISANLYLSDALKLQGLDVPILAPIWANEAFQAGPIALRDVDYVMVLRRGAHKRLDLYLEFIRLARCQPDMRLAVISPDDDLIAQVRGDVDITVLRPSMPEMRSLYARSKIFVHLSEHEGFGLPPLEAMGAGCIPLCRDSGGVRAYMRDPQLSQQLFDGSVPTLALFEHGQALLASAAVREALERRAREVFSQGLHAAQDRREAVSAIIAA